MTLFYLYWISTILLASLYLTSAITYLVRTKWVRQYIGGLGYTADHLIPLMIIVKILGPLAIVTRISVALSDLAYAGMFFHLLLAAMALIAGRKGVGAPAIAGLVLLVISFATQNAARNWPSPYAPAVNDAVFAQIAPLKWR